MTTKPMTQDEVLAVLKKLREPYARDSVSAERIQILQALDATIAAWNVSPSADVVGVWRKCYSSVIKSLATLAQIGCPDDVFERDLMRRSPAMDEALRIRAAMDDCGKTLSQLAQQGGESKDA